MRQTIEADSRFGNGTEASVVLPVAGAVIVLFVGYLVCEWIWRKLGAPKKPDPFWDTEGLDDDIAGAGDRCDHRGADRVR